MILNNVSNKNIAKSSENLKIKPLLLVNAKGKDLWARYTGMLRG